MAATFTVEDARRGTSTLLNYVETQLEPYGGGALKVLRRSDTDIPHVSYMIKGRVISWGKMIRALSDRYGVTEASRFQWTEKDFDREVLDLMDDPNYRYMSNRIVTAYMITDADRRAAETPYVLFKGVLRKVALQPYRGVVWEAQDYLSTEFSTANDEELLPRDSITADFFPGAPESSLGLPVPQVYGKVDEPGPVYNGLVPCIPVGPEVISGTTWQRFLISKGACFEIRAMFSNGVLWGAGQQGVDYLVPGYTGWHLGAQKYVPITVGSVTKWFTIIYARGPIADAALDGSAPLTANVYGLATNADGTGSVIEDLSDIYLHWYTNFAIQDWNSGAWLGIPNFHNVLDFTPRINSASFAGVKGSLQGRLGGGYVGAGIIGSAGDRRTKGAWIQAFDTCLSCRHYFNRNGQFCIVLPEASLATAKHTQDLDIIKGSFSSTPIDEDMRNVVPFHYGRRWAQGAWRIENKKVLNQTSIDGYKVRREDLAREFWFLINDAVAENCAAHHLRHLYHPPRPISYEVKAYALAQLDLGNTVELVHRDGAGNAGWSDRSMFIERFEYSPNRRSVYIAGFDLDSRGTLSYTTESGFAGTNQPVSFSPDSTDPAIITSLALLGGKDLGGSRSRGRRSASYGKVPEYKVAKVNWTAVPTTQNLTAFVEVMTRDSGTTVTPRISRSNSVGVVASTAVTGTPATNTTWETGTPQTLVIPRGTGIEHFVLEITGDDANEDVFGAGYFELVPI